MTKEFDMNQKYKILIGVMALAFASLACGQVSFLEDAVVGSQVLITESWEVTDFNRVTLEGFGEVRISQGESESLSVTTDDNIMPFIEVDVRGNTLVLGFTRDGRNRTFNPSDSILFEMVVTDLNRIDITGAGDLHVQDLDVEMLHLELTGAGQLNINSLTADELVVRQSGAGSTIVSGEVRGQEVSITGAGNYHAPDLKSETALIEITGIGSATVWATETLDVEIASIGTVIYYGDPRVISSIAGLGNLVDQGVK
jgi:hypothetical protein